MGTPPTVRPVTVVHQEGVVAVMALLGLGLRDGSPLPGLAARGGLGQSVVAGVAAGVVLAGLLWLLERFALPPLRRLAAWQAAMVADWGTADALAVAVLSGLAEEALARALLQPLIGLVPAALVFALLHLPPDRSAWSWPLMAFALGIALGSLFARWGFPAAAAAHAAVNAVGLLRLARSPSGV